MNLYFIYHHVLSNLSTLSLTINQNHSGHLYFKIYINEQVILIIKKSVIQNHWTDTNLGMLA